MVAVELFGVGIAPRHHRRPLGDADVGLPQPHAVAAGQAVEPLDRRVQQLGVGREGDVLGLHRGVDRDPRQVPGPQRAALVRHPQALGQQQVELVAQPLAPMAEVGALVREGVLEELLAGEVLEVRVVDPALADALVGQPEHVLEQQQADHEAALDAGPPLVAVERRDLAVDPRPVDLAGELHQLVLHVDDLVEPGPEQIAFPRRLVLLRPHRVLRCGNRITACRARESRGFCEVAQADGWVTAGRDLIEAGLN